ncbi:MAG: hypothetical protein AB7H97_20390 [Pseudobdellovibrionaceae bacterium]
MCEIPEILLLYFLSPDKISTRCHLILSWAAEYYPFTWSYFIYLGMTLVLEAPAYWYFLRPKKWWTPFFAGNFFTHPIVNFFFPWMAMKLEWSHAADVGTSEIFAWLGEAIIISVFLKGNFRRGLLVSFIANLISWRLGSWILYLV